MMRPVWGADSLKGHLEDNMKYLQIRLCAPLQYFSHPEYNATRNHFPTESHPTIRVLCGMISAALGYDRDDNRNALLRQSLSAYYMHTKEIEGAFQGVYTYIDDQTIKPQRLSIFSPGGMFAAGDKDAQGFLRVNGTQDYGREGILKTVEYVEDADFTVYLGGTDEELATWYKALRNPEYMVYIGRRNCIPTIPIVGKEPIILTREELPECILPC